MSDLVYAIVEHDGGWAYKMGGAFSETFPTREDAVHAAARAAKEQTIPGETAAIAYQDAKGVWHNEVAQGGDRPTTEVQ